MNAGVSTKQFEFHWDGGAIALTAEFYNVRMYPTGCMNPYCSTGASKGYVSLLSADGSAISANHQVRDNSNYNNFIEYDNLAAGDYVIKV